MSTRVFCCSGIVPYRPHHLAHESKFNSFLAWAAFPRESSTGSVKGPAMNTVPFAVQLVQQVNFGRLESKRYFVPLEATENVFAEMQEEDLIQANFEKLNTYKNFKCNTHNKFFEVNVYQKNPVNKHHWRANLARPAQEIDLPLVAEQDAATSSMDTVSMGGTSAGTAATSRGSDGSSSVFEDGGGVLSRWISSDFDHGFEPMKDFTACDRECGYCGQCDY